MQLPRRAVARGRLQAPAGVESPVGAIILERVRAERGRTAGVWGPFDAPPPPPPPNPQPEQIPPLMTSSSFVPPFLTNNALAIKPSPQ